LAARTILYTGKGGVGKTSVAACTAMRCADAGLRTLLLSTDAAHSLAAALETTLGNKPAEVAPRLWAQEVDAQIELERHWSAVQGWLGDLLVERGVDRISAEELTVPPGMDELFSLLTLREAHASDEWDAIVVDCAPTGETLRLLSFPDVAQWWLDKVFPVQGQLLAAARPLARSLLDLPLPGDEAMAEVRRLSQNLIAMNEILRDRTRTSVRLVMNPEQVVVHEAMRTFTYLNLYGYLTDAVVVNRVFPDDVGVYFDAWRANQQQHLTLVESAFAPVPVLRAPYFEREVVGTEMLGRLGSALFGNGNGNGAGVAAEAILHDAITQELSIGEDGAQLRLALPFASKGDVSLKKLGLELIVRVDGRKRTILLPPALAAFKPTEARLEDGALQVSFEGAVRA
jgi:arsenite/tail-anchored protein-transporting ATPase